MPVLESEKWLSIPTWEGKFDISSHGRIRRIKQPFLQGDRGGLRKLVIDRRKGYLRITLNSRPENRIKTYLVHALVCSVFNQEKPIGNYQVAHNDGNPANNYYKNLRWATAKENTADRYIHGTIIRGDKCPWKKINSIDVSYIKELYEKGFKQNDLAKAWNLHQSSISRIVHEKRWKEAV